MDDNKVHFLNQALGINEKPEVIIDQRNPREIIFYFEPFMNEQERLRQEVEKIAPKLSENTLIEIIKECHKRNDNKSSGYKRLCGTFLVWKTNEESRFSVKKFAEQNLNNKGARLYFYKNIVERWKTLQRLAKEQGKDAYKMSLNALDKLLQSDEIKELDSIREKLDSDGCFTPEDCEDARKKIKTYIACRQGQPKFRRLLIQAYNGQCAITGFDFEHALEAAHIHPYKGDDTNNVWNGLLLRGDIHTLFDLYLITVHPTTKEVRIAPELKNTKYKELDGKKLNLPKDTALHPSDKILKWHYKKCKWINNQ